MISVLSRFRRQLLVAPVTIAVLSATSAFPKSKGDSRVQVSVSDVGNPVAGGIVSLDHLKNEDCAKLFSRESATESNGSPSQEDLKRAGTCITDTRSAHTDQTGSHSYDRLEAGWYMIRLQWPMSQPPASKDPIGCTVEGWAISYVPWKESGKNRGFAQGPTFELKSGETRRIDFDYNGLYKIREDCPKPIKWVHKK